MSVVTLLTDFGTRDYYVAAVKGTILRLAPGSTLVDITHDVAPGVVPEATFLLAAAARSFADSTVHLAVVDPGVGTSRRILVVQTDSGLFVAPDNGLLTPWLGAGDVYAVNREDLFLTGPGSTFHGRDRFAPIAAALARGAWPETLGEAIDDPVRLELPEPRRDGSSLHGHIVHVDRFGNLVTDIPAAWCDGSDLRLSINDHVTTRVVDHYAQLDADEVGILVGSLGTMEVSLNGTDLARTWRVSRGMEVQIDLQSETPLE
jgi:S-adenosylmethionine hydrolase